MSNISFNAEAGIISACMITDEAVSKAMEHLTPNDFNYPTHKEIFACICNLFNQNKKVDIVSIIYEKDKQKLKIDNGKINEISDVVLSDSNLDSHIKILRECNLKNTIEDFAINLKEQFKKDTDIIKILDNAREKLMSINTSERKNDYTAMQAVVNTIGQIEKAMKSNRPVGLSTYIHDLDCYIIMKPGNLITIASKKGVGKTMLANQIGFENAFKNKKVVFFTMEMEADEIINREIARRATIDLSDINHGIIHDMDRYSYQANIISSFHIIIDDSGKQTVSQIHSKIIKYKNRLKGLDLVIVDYIQLMKGGTGDSRQQRLADISANMKALAKHFKVPIIILSQLNHEGITREAEDIENDSDIVLKLSRPFYEEIKKIKRDGEQIEPEENYASVRVSKNRSGRTGKINLWFNGRHQNFAGWEKENE